MTHLLLRWRGSRGLAFHVSTDRRVVLTASSDLQQDQFLTSFLSRAEPSRAESSTGTVSSAGSGRNHFPVLLQQTLAGESNTPHPLLITVLKVFDTSLLCHQDEIIA